MNIDLTWLFPSSMEEAIQIQRCMAQKVIIEDQFDQVQTIGGMDVSNNLYDPQERIYAATVALQFPDMKLIEQTSVVEKQTFPYIPGLLGFREVPALVSAFKNLRQRPDVIMVDGHGISHPRGLGIASHIGVLLDIPTIGVAKSILVGQPAETLKPEAGSQVPLIWKNRPIAALYRTKVRSNPLIISAGHKISLATAIKLVIQCLRGYRLPEPTRQAHLAANQRRREG